jgi:hypothetical protein
MLTPGIGSPNSRTPIRPSAARLWSQTPDARPHRSDSVLLKRCARYEGMQPRKRTGQRWIAFALLNLSAAIPLYRECVGRGVRRQFEVVRAVVA